MKRDYLTLYKNPDKWNTPPIKQKKEYSNEISNHKIKKDSLYITLFFLFSIACIAGLRYEQRLEMQKGIAEKIIRFHVIANSDTKADQNLKLAVRDAVGIKMSGLLKDAADRSRSEAVIRKIWRT